MEVKKITGITVLGLLVAFATMSFYPANSFENPAIKETDGKSIPTLNQGIIDYVNTVINKRVDRGECWDLAYQALTRVGAEWDGKYRYGRLIDPNKVKVYPGDLIQFKGVKLKYQKNGSTYQESMAHHTAIVYEVIKPGVYRIAHQNTGFSGRKVGISDLRLDSRVRGRMMFYRPVKG